jgi:hypothetical protein
VRAVCNSGEAMQLARSLFFVHQLRRLRVATAIGLAVMFLAVLLSAQSGTGASQKSQTKLTPATPVIIAPSAEPATPAAPLRARTPEQMPPRVPEVFWDGKQLSIKSENSTLSDILAAVRARTGASIDIPPGAAAERVATKLGPASAREVLASLLDNSNFDYIIQASDKNEACLGSVILTPRGKAIDELAATQTDPEARRMPGNSGSRGQILEAAPPEAVPEVSSPDGAASAPNAAEQNKEPGAPGAEPAAASSQSPNGAGVQAVPPDSAGGAGSAGASDKLQAEQPVAPTPSGADASQSAPIPQTVQDLQRMNQERRQIQAQPNPTSSAPPN